VSVVLSFKHCEPTTQSESEVHTPLTGTEPTAVMHLVATVLVVGAYRTQFWPDGQPHWGSVVQGEPPQHMPLSQTPLPAHVPVGLVELHAVELASFFPVSGLAVSVPPESIAPVSFGWFVSATELVSSLDASSPA